MRALLRSGMGVARFNFSHGAHEAHQGVLDRYRPACKEEAAAIMAGNGPEGERDMARYNAIDGSHSGAVQVVSL